MNENRFDKKAKMYDRARSGYPREVVWYILDQSGKELTVADIGCGTGKLSAGFILADCTVYGVEPSEEMLQIAERDLGPIGFCGGADFIPIKATAEDTTLSDGLVDIVVVGQALHWFDIPRFKAECKRILKQGGKTFVVYNRFSGRLAEEYVEFLRENCADFKGFGGGSEGKVAEFFDGSYVTKTFHSKISYDKQRFVERALSSSYAPIEGEAGYEEFVQVLKDFFDKHMTESEICFDNTTTVYHTQAM